MNRRTMLLTLTAFLYITFFHLWHWDVKIQATAALFIIQILWLGRVFTLAFSSLLFMLLLSFHFFTYEETLSYVASQVVWLLFSTYIIAKGFMKTGLAGRLSLKLLQLSKGSGKALILLSFFLMLVLSILVPSNIGKANLVTSVLDQLLKNLKKFGDITNLGKSLFIGVSYMSAISGAFVATGASSTLYVFGLFTDIHPELSYLTWILYFAPPILLFVFVLWGLFLFTFPPESVEEEKLMYLLHERLEEMGVMNFGEKKMIAIMGITLLLWATQSVHGFSIPLVGLLGASLTMVPGIGIWDWNEAKKAVNWDMMLFFASTLMVSGMLIETGTVDWMTSVILGSANGYPPVLVLTIGLTMTMLIRLVFVNILGFLTITIPLAISIGESLAGFSSIVTAMAVFLAGVPGFFLITQSPVHLISYSFGYFHDKDLFRIGISASAVWLVILLSFMFFVWRWSL
ncbi:SLC13 family permease [Salimicrobium halophilum]|uniref:Sodium-dependent dicarboxylate transporter SdcS n=1 Tax=Salimicrobium halophilum TaxID=86666 RepID=A0A1G8SDL5_9BACI|nr:SLC13 family permease [Salimicrobium halophilum]SDJ27349.1 anion transporter [Salimicrobium halophilum]